MSFDDGASGVPNRATPNAMDTLPTATRVTQGSRVPAGAERPPQQRQALGDRGLPILIAFELQGDVAVVAMPAEDLGDAVIVQVQAVPQPAAEIRLRLHV